MTSQELPDDVAYEIVSRTCLKTVDSCKAVSKNWHNMIYETSFLPLYCARTKNVSGYFLKDYKHNKHVTEFVSLDEKQEPEWAQSFVGKFLGPNGHIVASCRQGLLCCAKRLGRNTRYYACKPTTGQCRRLPTPPRPLSTDACTSIMVVRSSSSSKLRYKIAHFAGIFDEKYRGEYFYSSECFLFDSDDWKWRRIENVRMACGEFVGFWLAVTAAGSIYWLTTQDNVLEFREADESFRKFSLPSLTRDYKEYEAKQLVEYRGRLGFVCLRKNDDSLELWVKELDSCSGARWRKEMEVHIGRVEMYEFKFEFCNAGILFMKAFLEAVFYNVEDLSTSRVRLKRAYNPTSIIQFRSDFEPVELGGRRRRRPT
ncbi:F-box protein-related [Striga asiatica]|uniref:F-box protein-related n=1 Tax=Striga asiatica TaxID=4170 RepID=A0A5A7QIE6_STRAF|nr:F-box protein-related [Striga asiatica]